MVLVKPRKLKKKTTIQDSTNSILRNARKNIQDGPLIKRLISSLFCGKRKKLLRKKNLLIDPYRLIAKEKDLFQEKKPSRLIANKCLNKIFNTYGQNFLENLRNIGKGKEKSMKLKMKIFQ
jgi:hypothetical protein